MEFKHLIEKALAVRRQFANAETNRYGREWSREELMLGFMKDVGDLAQLLPVVDYGVGRQVRR